MEGYLWFRGRGDRHVNPGRPAHREVAAAGGVSAGSRWSLGAWGAVDSADAPRGVTMVGSEVYMCIFLTVAAARCLVCVPCNQFITKETFALCNDAFQFE